MLPGILELVLGIANKVETGAIPVLNSHYLYYKGPPMRHPSVHPGLRPRS
jgi:hypothetical protein